MNRFSVVEEVTQVGRKKEYQYGIYDNVEDKVVVRFANKTKAELKADEFNEMAGNFKEGTSNG